MPRVPDRTIYDPVHDAWLHTGDHAVHAVLEMEQYAAPHSLEVAMDIETPGLDRQFEINCVTAAWTRNGQTHAVLLDPMRTPGHDSALVAIVEYAKHLIFHNAPFDIPGLFHRGLVDLEDIDRVVDTVVLARMAYPSKMVGKRLEQLATKVLRMGDLSGGMELAFKAAGFKTIDKGYEGMDIGSPIYRQGAMMDTVATLRLEPILRAECIRWTLDHPFVEYGPSTTEQAEQILADQETEHRIMLRRTAKGINVDLAHLEKYTEQVEGDRQRAESALAQHEFEGETLVGGKGKGPKIIRYIAEVLDELPPEWPRTPTGNLQATKELLDEFDHPLAKAQRDLAATDQILEWVRKVEAQAGVTGRCHPQVGILGASATGRMSVGSPPYQQFSGDARPVFLSDNPDADANVRWYVDDEGNRKSECVGPGTQLWSIDWSQIEPVTMGLMAHDTEFLAPFEAGLDMYEPLTRAAGVSRKIAKVVLLALMYGQGITSMARKIGHSKESAAQIRRQLLAAMPGCSLWMEKVVGIAETWGKALTVGGRVLPVDKGFEYRAINYTIQGSAYDVLAHAILGIEAAGLSDCILLAMHDEIVIDATEEQAIRIEEIMLTPPPFLEKWADRPVTLRCDRQPLGLAWTAV